MACKCVISPSMAISIFCRENSIDQIKQLPHQQDAAKIFHSVRRCSLHAQASMLKSLNVPYHHRLKQVDE